LVRWQLVGYHQLCVAWACIDCDSPILRFMSQICLCCMKSLEVSYLKQKKVRFFFMPDVLVSMLHVMGNCQCCWPISMHEV
jgi:hypothetical protein